MRVLFGSAATSGPSSVTKMGYRPSWACGISRYFESFGVIFGGKMAGLNDGESRNSIPRFSIAGFGHKNHTKCLKMETSVS